jgi:HAE1 family hydrophobic/amphiphilic exporter-1
MASLLTALYLDPMLTSLQKMRLDTVENVVWAVHAYQVARREKGYDRLAALAAILPLSVGFALSWLKSTALEAFGPAMLRIIATRYNFSLTGLVASILRIIEMPFLLLLLLMQILLKTIISLLVMVLFVVSVVAIAIIMVAQIVLRVVLWPPLKIFDVFFGGVRFTYAKILRISLQYGPVVLLLAALLAAHSVYLAKYLGRELIPPLRQGEFAIRMEAPPGTRLEETEILAAKVEKVILENTNVASVGVEIGIEKNTTKSERGENIAQFSVVMKNPEKNAQYQDEVIKELRDQITAVTPDQITFVLPTLFSFKTAVELQVRGDDYDELKRVGQRAFEAVYDIEGMKDAELSVKKGYPEIIIELDRDLIAAKGLSPIQVAQRLRTEIQGDIATRFSRGGEKIDMRVRADQARLKNVQDLRSVSIIEGNPPIPLSAVAKISVQDGPSEIRRIDQRQVVLVRGNVEGFDLGSVSTEIEKRLEKVDKPADYSFVLGGQNRELRTSYTSLQFALLMSIFLVYVVMACQFESLIQPALIMFTIPLGFIGVIDVLYLIDMPISIAVFMGGILLVGIVVNNSMLLVDYANQLQARGRTKRQAIFESGTVRFRPVLMTAITTIVGAIPMAMSSGEGAELRRPLAMTVISGLTVATILTLVIIPVVYDLFSGNSKQKKAQKSE